MFLTEPEPPRGTATAVHPGIRRIVAANPGPMTYWGTNTYILDGSDGATVLDPGPDDPAHVHAVLAAAGPVARIVLSHTHHDHLGATMALRAATGAPVHAWHAPEDPSLVPDVPLHDGDTVAGWEGWTALHTPGHAPDHLCFAGPDGVLLSADHVMSWSTSVIAPPGGDMGEYFASLRRVLARTEHTYLPGHGPPHPGALPFVQALLDHRLQREHAILDALGAAPRGSRALTEALYANVDPRLRRAAERNVLAHLAKLAKDGQARAQGDGWVRV